MRRFSLFGTTDQGLHRTKNEDTILVDEDRGFCLVADGIGGTAAGDIASQLFAQTAANIFSTKQGRDDIGSERVKKTFQTANHEILAYAHDHPDCKGMGCTAELLTFNHHSFVLGHMGDSRTYRLRNKNLKQITTDHSLVQEQLDQGMITKEEALHHAYKNVILRAVGIKKDPALDLLSGKIFPEDIFLLCSDGLSDMVDDAMIQEILESDTGLGEKTEALVHQANANGGKDNISVVLAQVVSVD
jgi:protein phosphatase